MLPSEYLEKGWTQGKLARDYYGVPVNPASRDAVSWCMTGAIDAAYNICAKTKMEHEIYYFKFLIRRIIGRNSITEYNDSPERTHDEVIQIMKRAERELKLNQHKLRIP